MAMTLGRRIAVLVVTTLMTLMMVAGPVASKKCVPEYGDKNSGWGDGNGGGKIHPK